MKIELSIKEGEGGLEEHFEIDGNNIFQLGVISLMIRRLEKQKESVLTETLRTKKEIEQKPDK